MQLQHEAEAPVRGAYDAIVRVVFAEEVFRQLELVKSEAVQDKGLFHFVQQKFEVFQNLKTSRLLMLYLAPTEYKNFDFFVSSSPVVALLLGTKGNVTSPLGSVGSAGS